LIFSNIYSTRPADKSNSFFRTDLFIALVSGTGLGLAFPPLPFSYLALIALVPYLIALDKKDSLAAINKLTYLTFLIFNVITLYWVGSWTKEADTFLMISGGVLVFFNPLLFLIPSTAYYMTGKITGKGKSLMLLPFFWATYEFLYTLTEFRFPWLTLGNVFAEEKFIVQSADITGVYGLSILIIFANIFLYRAIKTRGKKYFYRSAWFFAFIALPLTAFIYGIIKSGDEFSADKYINVGIVQPDLNPWNKWESGNLDEQAELYLSLSEKSLKGKTDMIVWPESAMPVYLLSGGNEEIVAEIKRFTEKYGTSILTGMPHAFFYYDENNIPEDAKKTPSGSYYQSYNSILLFNRGQHNIDQYGKIKLVPFGEKVPYVEKIPILGKWIKWNVGISSWNTGKDTTLLRLKMRDGTEAKLGGVICIESIYPDFVAQFVKKGAELLVVVTNDSWYGYSSGPFQHKAFSRIRAIENRRWLVRCANGGISGIISPNGDYTIKTELFTQTAINGKAGLRQELSFYSRYPLLVPVFSLSIFAWGVLLFYLKKIQLLLYRNKK